MRQYFFFIAIALSLTGCGFFDTSNLDIQNTEYVKDPYNPSRIITKEQSDKIGRVNFKKTEEDDGKKIQINKYLWNACLDVLNDMPASQIKPEVGIYETDYIQLSDKQVRIRCRIKGNKILSENIDVMTFSRKSKDDAVTSENDLKLKEQVLLRARELKSHDNRAL